MALIAAQDVFKVVAPETLKPSTRLDFLERNIVWQWVHDVSDASPVQPVCNLGTGFNEQSPPDFVKQVHADVLEQYQCNQYAPISGLSNLKAAICRVYSPLYQRPLNQDEIIITSGAQEALLSSVMAFLGPTDEAIIIEPAFTMYIYQVSFSGAKINYVPLRPPLDRPTAAANEWKIDLAELEAAITPRTKMLYFNNPQNPLGKVFTREELRDIGNLCVKHDLVILSDEVYERVVFNTSDREPNKGPTGHIPFATLSSEIASHTLTAISLGKLFNATGWRVGFLIGPSNLIRYVMPSHLITAYSSSTPAQEACAVGLLRAEETGWWTVNSKDIAQRLQYVSTILDEVGLQYVEAAGGWFLWVNIEPIQIPAQYIFPETILVEHNTADWKACYFMIQEIGVSSIPGTCFYSRQHKSMGSSFVRIGACKNDEGLKLARERLLSLKQFIKQQ